MLRWAIELCKFCCATGFYPPTKPGDIAGYVERFYYLRPRKGPCKWSISMSCQKQTLNFCWWNLHFWKNKYWLVVSTLWKIWKSVGMMTFPRYGKIKTMFQTTNQNPIVYIYISHYIPFFRSPSKSLLLVKPTRICDIWIHMTILMLESSISIYFQWLNHHVHFFWFNPSFLLPSNVYITMENHHF